jgi:hypothetical protein
MNRWLLLPIVVPLLAAGPVPRQQLSLAVPTDPSPLLPLSSSPLSLTPKPGPTFEPAPTPNRDVSGPMTRASDKPSFGPSLFTTRNQFRGDGFSPGSTAQSEQEKRVKPGAGFSLHMPFAPQ